MIRNRYRCSLAATQELGKPKSVRASQGHQTLLFSRLCMPISFLFVLLGFCHSTGAQSNIYNPNNLNTSNIIQAMKTPHSDLVIVSAHRGLHAKFGDDSTVSGIPENSLTSVEAAASAGLELLEVDVKLTSDGIPICSHDVTWGRETNPYTVGGNVFDPFTTATTPGQIALNPRVDSMTATQTQTGYNLRDSVSFIPQYGSSGSAPPTLQNIIDLINRDQIASVLAIDVKDVPSFQAAWAVVKRNQDWLSQPFSTHVVWKVNGFSYTTPQAFKAAFPDYAYINFWPNYNTSQIAASVFGSESEMMGSLNAFWADPSLNVIAPEITQKQPGGILSVMRATNIAAGHTVAEFAAYKDYVYPNDPNHVAQFFWTGGTDPATGAQLGGSCCVDLQHYYFNPQTNEDGSPNPNYDPSRPSDTADDRGDINFVVGQGFNVITTDDVVDWANQLTAQNLRNISYMELAGGHPLPGGPAYYTYCAAEKATCSFSGTRIVKFGANASYLTKTVTNTTACTVAAFGGPDPAPGVYKGCFYSNPINYDAESSGGQYAAVYCADEGQTCNFSGSGNANFVGSPNANKFLFPVYRSVDCSVAGFGNDPDSGVKKACFYNINSLPGAPSGFQFCAPEGQWCYFSGPGTIKFGANGIFNTVTVYGGIACNDAAFGDPTPGVAKNCFYSDPTGANPGPSELSGASAGGSDGTGTGVGTSTCDIYASGGTPCVAAHSTVRALFSGYSGRLYQVTRASDSTSSDIGTLSTGGYANGAGQDSFCASTTCTITMIYDQTSNQNDLTVPKGDSQAVANALPIQVNGNNVYGVKVTHGVGYRNNATRGVAIGGSPEGMYMVTSGTFVNNGCCFDYGNAETDGGDDGTGRMDALNFGTDCGFPPCSGNGPWVEADLENGQFMGNGSNLGDVSMGYDFVTAMLKNDGTSTFALKGGNAQSGVLTTDYSGTLPNFETGYIPMRKLGAIILGTGGDNSHWDQGSFFEGAMTSGYPTDATENAVQANIVVAGYNGDSSGGSVAPGGSGSIGSIDASEPPGPYTGPNDPGGSGPQDGFAQPSAEQPNDIMATKPALASFNGSLYVAFQGVNVGGDLYVVSSPTGNNFPAAPRYTNLVSTSAPALAAFNNQLFMAFRGLNVDNDFYVTSASDGVSFPTATRYTNIQMGGAPALAVFNNQLCASFQANDTGHTLHVTCSSDGVNWPAAWQVPNVVIGSDPAMAVFNGIMYIAFRANDPSNDVWIASSSDGVNFSSTMLGQTMGGSSTPALVASNGILYYIYGANDSDNEMLVLATTNGTTWTGPAAYLNDKMSPFGPGAAAFGNGVSVGFQSNDSRQVLFVTNKVTEASSYTGPSDPGGPGPQDAFAQPAAEQPNDIMATKPALASFNGSLYLAFQGVNVGSDLYVTSSPTGNNFPAGTRYTNIQMGTSAPAMAAFNNQLYVAFQGGTNVGSDFYITSSPTGSNFPAAARYTNIQMGGTPALAVFNNQLCASFQAYDPGHTLHVTCSSDGVTWPAAWQIPNVKIGSDPAMAVFNGKLYVAFRADDPSNDVWIASSSDGVNFSSYTLAGQTMGGSSAPALAVSNCTLYYIYGANDQANEMLVMASTDGSTWQGPAAYLGVQMGATGPAATAFGNGVSVGFQSNDSRNVLFVTSGIGGLGRAPGPCQ